MSFPSTHQLDAEQLRSDGRRREWLLTEAQGAFALSSARGIPTRRYHGWLVAPLTPPLQRVMALNLCLEWAFPDRGEPVPLTSLAFLGGQGERIESPDGGSRLERFERGATVAWAFRLDNGLWLWRTLLLHEGEAALTVRYALTGGDASIRLRVAPMTALRGFHDLTHRGVGDPFRVESDSTAALVRRGGLTLALACSGAAWESAPDWWYGIWYEIDNRRGQEAREDLFVPGHFDAPLAPGEEISLTAALSETPADAIAEPPAERVARLSGMTRAARKLPWPTDEPDRLSRTLALAADDYRVARRISERDLASVIAGYPWFADWGRDALIALPGLFLATGAAETAERVLDAFAGHLWQGLVPNCFDESGRAAAYNTVDASLWFIHAALEYADRAPDQAALSGWLGDAIDEIVDAYRTGTAYEIGAADDGLVTAGAPDTQLTWMDAAATHPERGEKVVFTPRHGKAVEINALWCHALNELSRRDPSRTDLAALAKRAGESFRRAFVRDDAALWDHIRPDGTPDPACRPNQVIAAAVASSPLTGAERRAVLERVESPLLTPYGPRTLPPDDPNYHPCYAGPPFNRDRAYHQGTVWPWLLGPYAEAILRAGEFSAVAREAASRAVSPQIDRLLGKGEWPALGQLEEIHDGASPHAPRGCPAQAWSIAAILRTGQLLGDKSDG